LFSTGTKLLEEVEEQYVFQSCAFIQIAQSRIKQTEHRGYLYIKIKWIERDKKNDLNLKTGFV
jgi:hypothetical protein